MDEGVGTVIKEINWQSTSDNGNDHQVLCKARSVIFILELLFLSLSIYDMHACYRTLGLSSNTLYNSCSWDLLTFGQLIISFSHWLLRFHPFFTYLLGISKIYISNEKKTDFYISFLCSILPTTPINKLGPSLYLSY